jgi:DNA repair protein RecO (recombination protein O)
MNQLVTKGIVLSRTDYDEAARIITMLTPDYGKLRLMAKGVRRVKSKLAGGIELFSISDITFVRGKGEVGTLISARLLRHYGNIVKDIERVQLGYDLIKILNRATEDEPEPEYFHLLENVFVALNEQSFSEKTIRLWFYARLLTLAGHTPNLTTDTEKQKLDPTQKYTFDTNDMIFTRSAKGRFSANHIKFLRLSFSAGRPKILAKVENSEKLTGDCLLLVQAMLNTYIKI